MNVDTKCKSCGLPLQVEIDDAYAALREPIIGDIPTLAKMATCNRCADFRDAKNRIFDAMQRNTNRVYIEENTGRPNSDSARQARENIRRIAQRFFGRVCDYYLVETVEDGNFLDDLSGKPYKWPKAFVAYETHIRRIAKQARIAA